jgi:hypothetical protein
MRVELDPDMAREGSRFSVAPRGLPGRVYRGIHGRRRSHTWGPPRDSRPQLGRYAAHRAG